MKKISYIICLTAILCSCNNELPIENVQELQTPKSKEDSEILSFKNSEEFLSTIENVCRLCYPCPVQFLVVVTA